MKIQLDQYKELQNSLKAALENIHKSLDEGKSNDNFITLGINGKNFDFPLCADLYSNLEMLLKDMISVEEEDL